eukprot:3808770-Rhodomonas_salina.1
MARGSIHAPLHSRWRVSARTLPVHDDRLFLSYRSKGKVYVDSKTRILQGVAIFGVVCILVAVFMFTKGGSAGRRRNAELMETGPVRRYVWYFLPAIDVGLQMCTRRCSHAAAQFNSTSWASA